MKSNLRPMTLGGDGLDGSGVWPECPAQSLEVHAAGAALRRGRYLSRGTRLRVVVAWLLPAALAFLLNLTVTRAVTVLRSGCPSESDGIVFLLHMAGRVGWCFSAGITEEIRIAIEAIFTAALIPVFPTAQTVFYYDQRIRQEGFDIEMMMQAAGINASDASAKDVLPITAVESAEQPL